MIWALKIFYENMGMKESENQMAKASLLVLRI
jgi:hypothetical protein